MTVPENSLSRWSRLKREAVSKGQAADQDETSACSTGPRDTPPEAAMGEGLVDPGELPAIDAINFDTDIRAFLKSRVPAELTRAALRRAWISDPAIRDFIGIAENQWDFNDPAAISGFGPLLETDDVPVLLGQAVGQAAELIKAIAEVPIALQSTSSTESTGTIAITDQSQIPDASGGTDDERRAIRRRLAESEAAPLLKRRAHGGALPR